MNGNRQIGTLYSYLSALRLAQGDTVSALHLINNALEMQTTAVPPPFLRYQRARVHAGAGRLEESLEEYKAAVQLARDWRLRVVPADAFRIGADVSLQELYAGYIETAMALFRKTGRPELARLGFELAETNRAASLRESSLEQVLPAHYWATVANLRKAIAGELAGDPEAKRRAEGLRLRLAKYQHSECDSCEISHQIKERTFSEKSLSVLQKYLAADEALLSFHTSERTSYVWAMTKESFETHELPGRPAIAALADSFRRSLAKDRAAVASSGEALRQRLFGLLGSRVMLKKSWILSVDEPLHQVPFSALPAFDPSLQYLAESHSIRLVPGAAMIGTPAASPASERFVGFADAIYNSADSRWTSTVKTAGAELPRLTGTRDEVSASARLWGPDRAVVTGADFTRASIRKLTSTEAAVVHFGAHVVPDRSTRGGAAIALGLNGSGTAEYLTPVEIAGWRCPVGVVVLSACDSGSGEALPGAGLVGLTRAWLVAGAQAVTATHWPITDDARPFFSSFYQHLRRHSAGGISAASATASLREAQIDMIRAGGSHADPRYWAAFFLIGRE
jgi:CHAT domain-containing protein